VFLLEADCLILRSNTIENIVFSQNISTGFLPGLALKIIYLRVNNANGLTLQRHLLSVVVVLLPDSLILPEEDPIRQEYPKRCFVLRAMSPMERPDQGDAPSFSFDKKAVRGSEMKSTGWICVPLGACDGH
jgi:hypothetical protein